MNGAVTHQMIMLRPMQAGISGYARLQGDTGRQLIQVNLRGMQCEEMRVFWYAGEGLVREVGRSLTNLRGEASLHGELPLEAAAPRRLMALLITDGDERPRPLALGLCTAQSAGSLMDAKNALLALCDKLARLSGQTSAPLAEALAAPLPEKSADQSEKPVNRQKNRSASNRGKASPKAGGQADGRPDAEKVAQKLPLESAAPRRERPGYREAQADRLPREVFLPAIEAKARPERRRFQREMAAPDRQKPRETAAIPQRDETAAVRHQSPTKDEMVPGSIPLPAAEPFPRAQAVQPSAARQRGLPADRLPCLQWPAAFAPLAGYFDRCMPQRLLDWPGWRFIQVPESKSALWIGYRQQDGRVQQVAYALPADAKPPQGQPFQPARAADGRPLQVLVLSP